MIHIAKNNLIIFYIVALFLLSNAARADDEKIFEGVHELPLEAQKFTHSEGKAAILSQCSALFLSMSNIWSAEDTVNKTLLHSFGEKLYEKAVWMKGGLEKESLSKAEQKLAINWVQEKISGFHQDYVDLVMVQHQQTSNIYSDFITMDVQVCNVLLE